MPLSDFNFLFGTWDIHNRALRTRLRHARDWNEFSATFECNSLGHLGNVAYFRAGSNSEAHEGVSLRLYNPETGEWTIRWADSHRPGAIQPAVAGRFERGVGVFYGNAFYDTRPVRVRIIWTRGPRPRFEQAFSVDRGRSWETNWQMVLTPAIGQPVLAAAAVSGGLSVLSLNHKVG